MTDLAVHLERLGLEQYLDAFTGEGFDTWETLLDVQESDLEILGVKLGHRRKLQRAIAEYRGISYERLLGSPAAHDSGIDFSRTTEGSQGGVAAKEGTLVQSTETKRKYRRHPKADENAPEKPPSAYVLFSNRTREEVKAENLSFTEIAKLVGDRWQKLDQSQKEPFESQAASLKEQYNIQLSAYKKTESYKEYMQYLNEFKAKHGPQTEAKRPKLDPQSSGGSLSATSVDISDNVAATSSHARVGSMSSIGAASHASTMTSPPGLSIAPVPSLPTITSVGVRGLAASMHQPNSPQIPQYGRERRLIGQMSSHSSLSDDSGQVTFDALSRTATLSLNTPPTGTPPLPAHALGNMRADQGVLGEGFTWPSRAVQPAHQQGSVTPSGPSSLGSGMTLPSPTFSNEAWRERGAERSRQLQTSPSIPNGPQTPVLPLPPLLGPDRMSDLIPNQVQRTLPPLRQNPPPSISPSAYQGPPWAAQLSRQVSSESERKTPQQYDGGARQLDRNENEAASALAGLAARPGNDAPYPRGYSRRGPD